MKEENAIDQNMPDWTIEGLYRNAWRIVKNNKILWVFGMALGAGGYSSGNYSNSVDGKDIDTLRKLFEDSGTGSSELSKVLGASTDVLGESIKNIFSGIPFHYYFIFGIEIIALIVIGIITMLVYTSWAHAGLIEGIQSAISNKKPTIREMSEKAFGDLKAVLYILNVPYLIAIVAVLIIFSLLIGFNAENTSVLIGTVLISLPILIIMFGILSLTVLWALRIAVIDKKNARAALSAGFKIAKKKFWSSLLLGIVNAISTGLVYLAVFLPVIILGVIGFFVYSNNKDALVGLVLIGGIIGLAVIFGMVILEGIIQSFKASVWTIAYNAIRGKYEK